MSQCYDAIVIGLGGMGSATAFHLARRGRRVLGLEQFGPAHDRGASHGETRMIRQLYFESPAYVPLLLRSYELWEELASLSGESLLTVTGGLTLGPPDGEVVTGSLASARRWGLAHEVLSTAEARRRFPDFALPERTVGVYEPRAGYVRPEATVRSHLRLAARHGADLRFDQPPSRWSAAGDGRCVTVASGGERFTSGSLVVTPGAWAPALLPTFEQALRVERRVQFWFAPRRFGESMHGRRAPVYLWEYEAGGLMYGFPTNASSPGTVKVGFHREGTLCTADTLDRTIHSEEIEHARTVLERCVPRAAGRFVKAQACLYTLTPDGHFALGRHPDCPQVVVGCGFSGHGFKFVPVMGEILADLVDGEPGVFDIGLFEPTRLTIS